MVLLGKPLPIGAMVLSLFYTNVFIMVVFKDRHVEDLITHHYKLKKTCAALFLIAFDIYVIHHLTIGAVKDDGSVDGKHVIN